uniref:Uncharacterized protein n=1 Tax=Panagrolaimus sp. JU765 TaxID=591449 RepID=A0AC34RM08_9BILA
MILMTADDPPTLGFVSDLHHAKLRADMWSNMDILAEEFNFRQKYLPFDPVLAYFIVWCFAILLSYNLTLIPKFCWGNVICWVLKIYSIKFVVFNLAYFVIHDFSRCNITTHYSHVSYKQLALS